MKTQELLAKWRAEGRYTFTVREAEKTLGLPRVQTLNALHRLKQGKHIMSPAKGFYVIVPPEYQSFGCLPADLFISDLMQYLHQPYIGFLSAAQYYGATHQKPQKFQVVTVKNRLPIRCGRVHIEFIANKNVNVMPVEQINTVTSTIQVASPEVLARDLVNYPHYGAGISNVALVLTELAERIQQAKLLALTKIQPELFWIQRLGFLLELLGIHSLAETLAKVLKDKTLHWAHLVSKTKNKENRKNKTIARNKKWKIIVNTQIELDE